MLAAIAVLAFVSAGASSDFNAQFEKGSTPQYLDNYSAFKQTGGVGPYTPRRSNGIPTEIPDGYELDQVVLFHRHGERYPEEDNSQDYEASLAKINSRKSTPDSYSFLHSWKYYADNSTFGKETTSGPYAGIESSKKQGERYFDRWGKLLQKDKPLKIWSSSSQRVVDTANAFANGFFQGREDLYNVTVVDETEDANSLTPKCKGPEKTTCESETTLTPEFDQAAQRLNNDLGVDLKASDIENIMYVALYEINVNGQSPWIDVFTPTEWIALEYIRSYRLFCHRAHGSPVGLGSGSILTNATQALLSEGPDSVVQPLTWAFLHDTQISQIIGAAGFLNATNNFQANQVTFGNQIQISDAVPMGAALAFERFGKGDDKYVRVLLNEAVMPIDWCSNGPNYSCPLDKFVDGLNKRYKEYGWKGNCKRKHGSDPKHFTIFWE